MRAHRDEQSADEGRHGHHETLPVDPDVDPPVADLSPRFHVILPDPWDIVAVIALGGAFGSAARWGLGEALPHAADEIAWSTVVANVSGGLALGVLMVFVVDVWPPTRYARPFVGVGILGGFTTFSTYMLDTRSLIAEGEAARAVGYVTATLVAGLVAVVVGIVGTRLAVGTHRRPSQTTRAGAA
jgi:fluoride exporter